MAGASTRGTDGQLWGLPAIPVEPSVNLVVALSMFYGGMILLIRAWVNLRRYVLTTTSHEHVRRQGINVGVIASVWALPFLLGPPLGSRDVYAYAAQGRMAEVGIDVYLNGPGVLGSDPVLEAMDPIYLHAPVVYGPVFVTLSSLVSSLTTGPVASVLTFRMFAVLGLLVAAIGVFDIAKGFGQDPADALVLSVANPVILLHLVSGAHNEAVMLGFLVAGVALGRRARWRWLGIALCAVGAAIKIPAILGVGFIAWPWVIDGQTRGMKALRLLASVAGPVAVVALAGNLTGWGWGWVGSIRSAEPVDAYLSITRVLGGALHLVSGFELETILGIARPLGLVVAAVTAGYLILTGHHSLPLALGWSLLLFAIMHPTTQPWYLTWGLLLMAAGSGGARNRAFMVLSAFAAVAVLPIGPQLGLVLLADTTSVVIALAMAALVLLTLSPSPPAPAIPQRTLDPDLVSVIVPTRNEARNIEPLVRRVADSFAETVSGDPGTGGSRVEVIFVDDSDDETAKVIQELATQSRDAGWDGPLVRLSHRTDGGRWGGLGGAVVDGFAEARGGIAIVIDGDLQHPPEKIPALVSEIRSGIDLVVASRRIPGGSGGHGLTATRDRMSRWAANLSRLLFPYRVGRIADPLSGYFAIRLDRLDVSRLHPDGFKILIEVLATHAELSTLEIPFGFEDRHEGESKASLGQGLRFLSHLIDLRLRCSRPWAGSVGPQRVFRSS